uniref:UDP-glucuronosyltransferase n=2 Tax=Esox lucius TaxID=8010 RepID=A0A3P8YXG3_ESOLU
SSSLSKSINIFLGKVLVFPMEGSHWLNMEILIKALHAQGHSVTVVRANKSWYVKEESSHYRSITVNVTAGVDEQAAKIILQRLINAERGQSSVLNFLRLQMETFSMNTEVPKILVELATNMIQNQVLINTLKDSQYDLVLTDPCWGTGVLMAHYLQLPLVFNVRGVNGRDGHQSIAPSPTSYIPVTGSGFTDKMTYTDRVKNMLIHFFAQVHYNFFVRPIYQALCEKYFQTGVDFDELIQGADLWLMRVDFVFEFPRPTMPNVIYVGGFHCKPAKPLPQDLEDFIQSSGVHGVIIMSLGTLIKELPSEITAEIASAFAQMPQKVIWRHIGDRPVTLSNNTLLIDWMPQNDLLGHPKTRLFVSHGGTNGLQEAIYHGVPVVGLPVFFDQYDNLLRLQVRGGAKIVTLAKVDKDNNFLMALKEVLNEPHHKENMQKLSKLHRDQPMNTLDLATFWIEFVMRHKGAAHLRTESYRMPWYSYHSLDVMALLLAVVLLILFMTVALIRCLCFKMFFRQKFKHE